jgi:hypothetical protein
MPVPGKITAFLHIKHVQVHSLAFVQGLQEDLA